MTRTDLDNTGLPNNGPSFGEMAEAIPEFEPDHDGGDHGHHAHNGHGAAAGHGDGHGDHHGDHGENSEPWGPKAMTECLQRQFDQNMVRMQIWRETGVMPDIQPHHEPPKPKKPKKAKKDEPAVSQNAFVRKGKVHLKRYDWWYSGGLTSVMTLTIWPEIIIFGAYWITYILGWIFFTPL